MKENLEKKTAVFSEKKPFEKGSQDYRELKVSSNDNDLFLGGRT